MLKKGFLALAAILAIACLLPSFVNAEFIWAMKNPVAQKYLGMFLDHTYACVGNTNNCYAGAGSITGGNPVDGGYGDGKMAKCYALQCWFIYGSNGVCHQHTNRVLHAAGKTLNSCVRGYAASTLKYGICGDTGISFGTWSSCQKGCEK